LFYTDLFWKPSSQPIGFNMRAMICETTSYESRLYAYENDVMLYNIVPAFYGRFARTYMNVSYELSEKLRVFLKVSREFPGGSAGWFSRFQALVQF
jgi:hypothetical protein